MKSSPKSHDRRRSPRGELQKRRPGLRRDKPAARTGTAEQWQADDEKLDQALKDTFPASDPFSLG